MNSSKLIFNEVDQSFFIDSIVQGLGAVSVRTKRGPWGHDGSIITSWPEFVKKYGGEVVGLDGPSQVKRAFGRGAKLRINKMGHYTTIATPSTLDAVLGALDESAVAFAQYSSADVFNLAVRNKGVDANQLVVQIVAASNGDAGYFNLVITHLIEPDLNELYENLQATKTSVVNSTWLSTVEASKHFTPSYVDLSAASGTVRPTNGTWSVTGGTDGSAPVDGDYIGDSAGKTGFHAFNDYNDFDFLVSLDRDTTAVNAGLGAYTKARADHRSLIHIPLSNADTTSITSARAGYSLDSRYAYIITGGLKITNPFVTTVNPLAVSEIGDVLGIACRNSAQFGPWWAFAGTQRGIIDDALGVVNNFVETAKLDILAQRQVNVVTNKNGQIYIKGNLSGQLGASKKSFSSIVGLYIFLKKSLGPSLERYLEEPNDFITFKAIYNEVTPFLDGLKSGEKRALFDYAWKGDQFATNDSQLTVNNRPDLDQGKYRVKLWLKEIVTLQEFTIDLISTASGVTFEDNF